MCTFILKKMKQVYFIVANVVYTVHTKTTSPCCQGPAVVHVGPSDWRVV